MWGNGLMKETYIIEVMNTLDKVWIMLGFLSRGVISAGGIFAEYERGDITKVLS